jgi:hypothetical protein
MKTIIIFLGTMLFGTMLVAQADYTVIKVNGSISLKNSGKSLIQGTIFGDKDELLFGTNESRAAVVNPGKGRFVLAPGNAGSYTAKTCLGPAMANISSRGGSILNQVDLQNHFAGNYVFLGINRTQISNYIFPMDSTHFFFIRYKYHGEEINKKLAYVADTLIIDRAKLLTVDNSPIPNPDTTTMKMYYRKGNESVLLSEFIAVFPEENELKKEIGILLEGFKSSSQDEKLNQVLSYINEFYGKPDKESVQGWLKLNFGF